MCSVCSSVHGWKLVENNKSDSNSLNTSIQNLLVKGHPLLTMLFGMPYYFIMCLTNNFIIFSTWYSCEVGIKVIYLKNISTTTRTELYPSTFGRFTIKSIERLSHGHYIIGKGSSKPTVFWFILLSC